MASGARYHHVTATERKELVREKKKMICKLMKKQPIHLGFPYKLQTGIFALFFRQL